MSQQPIRSVLLFGAPGVGKGTQGKALGCIPGFSHFSMGEAFRSLDPLSELGRTVSEYSTRGELVPDEVTIQLWRQSVGERIESSAFRPEADILILDGVPRNTRQVELLRDQIDVLQIVHLECRDTGAEDEMIDRLRRRALRENRADDAKEDVIRRRWEIYRAETTPVLQQYPEERVVCVDPVGTPAEVLRRVLDHLAPLQRESSGNPLR